MPTNINAIVPRRTSQDKARRMRQEGRRGRFLESKQAEKASRTAGQKPQRPMTRERAMQQHQRAQMNQMKKFAPRDGFGWNNMRALGQQMPGQFGMQGQMPGQMPGYGQMYPPQMGYGQQGLAQMYGQQMGMMPPGMMQPGMGNPQMMQQWQAQLQGQPGMRGPEPPQYGPQPQPGVGGMGMSPQQMQAGLQQAGAQGRFGDPKLAAATQMDWGKGWEGPGGKEDWLRNYRAQQGLPR